MEKKTRILMVCLGNICRSPLAEGILKELVDPGLVEVDSAGTGGYHIGCEPDKRSIAVAAKYGIDIRNQRCRQLKRSDLQEFDLIYAMDRSNYNNIFWLATSEEERKKVRLLLSEISSDDLEVPDPYYGGPDGFDRVFRMIEEACEAISNRLKKENKG